MDILIYSRYTKYVIKVKEKTTMEIIKGYKVEDVENLIKDGYLVLDLEPGADNSSIFWLHLALYSGDGKRINGFDVTNISNVADSIRGEAKAFNMLKVLDKPYSGLNMPVETLGIKLKSYLDMYSNLPLFVYNGAPKDLPILNATVSLERPVYDVARLHMQVKGLKQPITLEKVANSYLVVSEKQADTHNPIQDTKLTNVALQGLLHSVKLSKEL